MRIVTALTSAGLLLLVTGCETPEHRTYSTSTAPVYGGDIVSSGPNGTTMVVPGTPRTQIDADRDLEANLRSQINRYGDLGTTTPDLHVYAQNGTVTLSGTVPSTRERDMIESLVRNQSGVVAVNDQLQVGYPPTGIVSGVPRVYSTPPDVIGSTPAIVYAGNVNVTVQATTLADRNLAQRVLDRLRVDPNLAPLNSAINMAINNGQVYLRGTVYSEQQHLEIVSVVQHTYGVSAVYDQLVVR